MVVYTALGDSITAGEGASAVGKAFPDKVVESLRSRRICAIGEVLAQPGWTSGALGTAVQENPAWNLAQSTAITVWIGGDNLAYAGIALLRGAPATIVSRSIQSYAADVGRLVLAIQKVSRAKIILCTQYNPFPNSSIAQEAIRALNASTYGVAEKLHVTVAPTGSWIDSQPNQYIAGYRTGRVQDALMPSPLPIHPNDRGHAVIAAGLLPYIHP